MKEKIVHFFKSFINNFVNSMIVIVYIIFLCSLYSIAKSQIDGDFTLSVFISSIGVGICGLILFVWFLSSFVYTMTKQKVQFSFFQYEFEKKLGCIMIVASTLIYAGSIYMLEMQKQKSQVEYDTESKILLSTDDYDNYTMDGNSFTNEEINDIHRMIYRNIEEKIGDKEKDIYIMQGDFVCDANNWLQSYRLKVYFHYGQESYIFDYKHTDGQLHTHFQKEVSGKITTAYPLWKEFRQTVETISVPNRAYTIRLAGPNQEEKNRPYQLSHRYYIEMNTINN